MSYIAVGGMVLSLGTSIIGGASAKKQAEKQRQLQRDMKLAELSINEKLTADKIRADQQNIRIGITVDSITKYRITLQEQSTLRLRDTWVTTAGTGVGLGVLYGLYLMTSND
jgi:hypothetical protein